MDIILKICLLLCVVIGAVWGQSYNNYNYDFVEDDCMSHKPTERTIHLGQNGTRTYGIVKATRSKGYSPNQNCSLYIWAPANHQILIRIRKVDIYKPYSKCEDSDYLSITGHNSTYYYCGYGSVSSALITHGNRAIIGLVTGNWNFDNGRMGFDVYYTAFHRGSCNTSHNGEHGPEFRCSRESRCIPRELTCDSLDNCGDWSDEGTGACGLSTGAIIAITVVSVLVGGTCIGFVAYHFYSKKREKDRRRQRQNEVNPTMTMQQCSGAEDPVTPNSVFVAGGPEPPPPYTWYLPDPSAEYKGVLPEGQGNYPTGGAGGAVGGYNEPPPSYDNAGYTRGEETQGAAVHGASDTTYIGLAPVDTGDTPSPTPHTYTTLQLPASPTEGATVSPRDSTAISVSLSQDTNVEDNGEDNVGNNQNVNSS